MRSLDPHSETQSFLTDILPGAHSIVLIATRPCPGTARCLFTSKNEDPGVLYFLTGPTQVSHSFHENFAHISHSWLVQAWNRNVWECLRYQVKRNFSCHQQESQVAPMVHQDQELTNASLFTSFSPISASHRWGGSCKTCDKYVGNM